jgi:hypothetical protein
MTPEPTAGPLRPRERRERTDLKESSDARCWACGYPADGLDARVRRPACRRCSRLPFVEAAERAGKDVAADGGVLGGGDRGGAANVQRSDARRAELSRRPTATRFTFRNATIYALPDGTGVVSRPSQETELVELADALRPTLADQAARVVSVPIGEVPTPEVER